MHPYFHIPASFIQRLNDTQARELIARLCAADIAREGLAPCVSYGGDQRAADGGVDVDIACRPARDIKAHVSRSVAAVQVKAEPLGPQKIRKEMAPKGVLRPSIAALAGDRGLYLIASTRDNPSFQARKDRTDAMRAVLLEHKLDGRIKVDFFGAREIANWVERYPTVGIWLRPLIGEPLSGWHGYGPWAYREFDAASEFVMDDEGRVFVPGKSEAVSMADALSQMRRDLRNSEAVRLIGLSGMGKTRLAQALFDERLKVHEPALSPDAVIYADLGDQLYPTPEELVGALPSDILGTIVIVDNCGQETHNALVEKLLKKGVSIGLLTIEYDIQDGIAPSTRPYKLEGASAEIMEKLLRSRFPKLSGTDREAVIGASDGNARLAFAIAETVDQTGQLSSLEDGELFRRLFHQKATTGDQLLRCARAASLLYSFEGEDLTPSSELSVLAALAEVSADTFYLHMAEISRRGLLQARGRMRAILPHAVSNYLAKEALKEISLTKVEAALFTHAPPRVRASFAHRLSYLAGSNEAGKLVASWLSPGGALADISTLPTEDLRTFRRVSAIRPELTLLVIQRFLDLGHVGSRSPYELRDIAKIARSIAYEADLFKDATRALVRLAPLTEADGSGTSETRGSIEELFQVVWSGTHATPSQRSELLTEFLSSDIEREWRLGIDCLDSALKTISLSSSGPQRFGFRSRDNGWAPHSMLEQQQWFSSFLAIAGKWSIGQGSKARLVRAALGKRARDLLHLDDGTIDALIRLAPSIQTEDGWPEAWTAVKLLLKRKNLDDDLRRRAEAFEQAVLPRGLRQRVVAKLHSRELFDSDDAEVDKHDERTKEAEREAEEVGQALGTDDQLLQEMLPQIMANGARGLAYSLGRGVAATHRDVRLLLRSIGARLAQIDEEQPLSLLFLRGLVSAWAETSPDIVSDFLDSAVRDPIWGRWFIDLQIVAPFDAHALQRVIDAVEFGAVPVQELTWVGMGGTLKSHTVATFTPLIDRIAAQDLAGVRVALDILHMQVFGAKELSTTEQYQLGRFCLAFLLRYDWEMLDLEQSMVEHELDAVVALAVKHAEHFRAIAPLLSKCIEVRLRRKRYSHSAHGNLITPIMMRFPEQSLSYLLSHPSIKSERDAAELILIEARFNHVGHGKPVISDDVLFRWAAKNAARRAAFSVRICRLPQRGESDTPPKGGAATQMFSRLYDLAPNKLEVINAFASRVLRISYSDRDIPHLEDALSALVALPEPNSVEEGTAREGVRSELTDRIRWASSLRSSRPRDEPEAFE